MKHVHFFSIVLLLSSARQSHPLNVTQEQLEITDKLGMVARKMIELQCLNPLLAPERQAECETLNASYLSLSQELHQAINARKKTVGEALQVPAEERTSRETLTNLVDKYSNPVTEAQEVKEAVVMLEPAHSTSGDLA